MSLKRFAILVAVFLFGFGTSHFTRPALGTAQLPSGFPTRVIFSEPTENGRKTHILMPSRVHRPSANTVPLDPELWRILLYTPEGSWVVDCRAVGD